MTVSSSKLAVDVGVVTSFVVEAVKKEFVIEILSPLSPGNFNLSDN